MLLFGGCIELFLCYHSAVVSSRLDLSFGGCIKLLVCYYSAVASIFVCVIVRRLHRVVCLLSFGRLSYLDLLFGFCIKLFVFYCSAIYIEVKDDTWHMVNMDEYFLAPPKVIGENSLMSEFPRGGPVLHGLALLIDLPKCNIRGLGRSALKAMPDF